MSGATGGPPVSAAPAFAVGSGGGTGAPVQAARIDTRTVTELHLCVRPDAGVVGFDAQPRSMYRNLLEALRANGMTPQDVVAEKLFLADVAPHAAPLGAVAGELYGGAAGAPRPASTIVQQPPIGPGRLCELQALALRAADGAPLASRPLAGLPAGASGRLVQGAGLHQIFVGGVVGGDSGDRLDFAAQAASMFARAGAALDAEGFTFRDVVRTWIYVADIGRDYAALNRERRTFFAARKVAPPPASTGIGGTPHPPDRGCSIDLRAVAGAGRPRVVPFSGPTMNEAPTYGSDFSRGTRVEFPDRTVLYVSGTASIDSLGRVIHVGDIEAQAERMFLNIETLLASQGAGYGDVVSAITYLKAPAFEDPFRRVAARRGLPERLPNTLCVAEVCRPEWLCEMEVTAILV